MNPPELKIICNEIVTKIPILQSYEIASRFEISPENSTNEYDLFLIAVAFHELERYFLNYTKNRKGTIQVVLPITRSSLRNIDQNAVIKILNELGIVLFSKDITFRFESHSSYQTNFEQDEFEFDAVCLFSGGADSYVGVLDSKKKYEDIIALNIKHEKSTRLDRYIRELQYQVLNPKNIPLETIQVPKQIGKGYSQTRGVLYQLLGGISADRHHAKNLVLSECGTTMYQPAFGLFDRITYTSDPFVQKTCKTLIEAFLGHKIEIITPFENNTKAEMFAASERKDFLKFTHSCISSRFGCNLGCCYGCAIRRMGFIVSGVEDSEYRYDLFRLRDEQLLIRYGKTTGERKITNLLELMRFSLDIINDYQSIDPVKRKRIDQYGKYDLYRRFALDTFATLHIIDSGEGGLNPRIERAYLDAMNYIGIDEIEKRIESVRSIGKR